MEPTTEGDANDEFARWLAETARAEQAAAAAQPPAAAPVPPNAAPLPPAAPEFFGADQLAAPPTRTYEPQSGGPQVARSSFQSPEAAAPPVQPLPPASPPAAEYVTPTVLPPAVPPAAPAAESKPSWAPDYTAPGSASSEPSTPVYEVPVHEAPAYEAPAYDAPAYDAPAPSPATPFFPDAAAAPAVAAAPEPPAPEPPAYEAPTYEAPTYDAPVAAPPAFPATPEPSSSSFGQPSYGQPSYGQPAAPESVVPEPLSPVPNGFDLPSAAPTYEPPSTFDTPASPPVPPAESFLPLQPAPDLPPASPPPADPFGALFETSVADDTAARLAASPPPAVSPPPPLVSPTTGELPADEDPLKSLFGLETEEQPTIREDSAPAATVLPTYTPDPVRTAAPAYTPEPAFATAAMPASLSESASAGAVPGEPAFGAPGGTSSYALTAPSDAPLDADPNAGTQFFGGGAGEWEEPPDLDRTTTAEKIAFVLAFILPPVGLIASIVAAVQSSRVRGWVHGFVRTGLVISLITTVAVGFAGAYFFKVLEDARKHDTVAAASTQFCSTIAESPDMISPPAFGFPAPAASIPDTITSIQAYVDKWTALASVSPTGIRTDVNRVAESAQGILDTVTESRLVNNDENIAVMSSVAESTNIVGWVDEYCG